MEALTTHHYILLGRHIFVYTAKNYRDDNKSHTFHNSKRVWSSCGGDSQVYVGARRAKQIEHWACRVAWKREFKTEVFA